MKKGYPKTTLKAAHVFPLLNRIPIEGSEYHELMLSTHLMKKGVDIDIYTTKSAKIRHRSAFSLYWMSEFKENEEVIHGIKTLRFDCINIPAILGQIISRIIIRRWQNEVIEDVSKEELVFKYLKNAESRNGIYDFGAQIGRGPLSWKLVWTLSRNINKYDVILVGFVPFSTIQIVTWLAKRYNKKIVILPLFHMEDRYHYWKSFFKSFRLADAVLVSNESSYIFFKEVIGVNNVVIAGPGIDLHEFSNMKENGEIFREERGLKNYKILLYVGRKEYSKQYQMAIEAVEILKDPNIKLVLIGRDIDNIPIKSKYVEYLGVLPRHKLLSAYAACDIFISPSLHESFGITFLEAWMFKKPVIGNRNCSAVSSLIKDGVNGFLCENSKEVAEKIKLLLENKSLIEHLGRNGYELTVSKYTWQNMADKVLDVYKKVMLA